MNRQLTRAFGLIGFFLMVMVAWAVERQHRRRPRFAVMERTILGLVTTIGWLMDRLPLPEAAWPGGGESGRIRLSSPACSERLMDRHRGAVSDHAAPL